MAGSFKVFEPTWVYIDAKLDTFLHDRLADVIAQVEGPLRIALVLYVILYGFAILRGTITEPIVDFSVRSLKLALIFMLATTPAYSDWITQPLFNVLPDTLTQAISGASAPNVGAAFDSFFNRGVYLGVKIGKTATVTDWQPILLSGIVYLIAALAAALGFGVTLVAKVALALLIALGPIFIACALFDATRRYFFGWLSQAINYIIVMALIITVFQLVLSLVTSMWASIDGQDPMLGGLLFVALSILGAIFFLQTPAIAAGVAGGASTGIADFANAMTPRSQATTSGQPAASAPSRTGSVQASGAR